MGYGTLVALMQHRCVGEDLFFQPEFFLPVAQAAKAHAEQLCGRCFVPTTDLQSLADDLSLDILQVSLQVAVHVMLPERAR